MRLASCIDPFGPFLFQVLFVYNLHNFSLSLPHPLEGSLNLQFNFVPSEVSVAEPIHRPIAVGRINCLQASLMTTQSFLLPYVDVASANNNPKTLSPHIIKDRCLSW